MSDGKLLKTFKRKPYLLILGILLVIGFFFAFYKFPYRYNLDDEIIRDVVVGIQGAREMQLPLIGAFSSTGPYTFGPWYFYQLILSNLVLHSFYSPWIYLGLAYVLSIAILFWIGKELKDNIYGLILAALGVFSPALIIGATHLTNPNLVTVFALLSVGLFIKVVKKNLSYWWTFVFGIVLGIAINIHYQSLSLLILPILMAINKKKKIFYSLSFLVGLIITFLPLLMFDLNNHWFNLRNFTYYVFYGKNAIYVPNRWLFYIRDFWPSYWGDVIGVSKNLAFAIMTFVGIIVGYKIIKKKISTPFLLIIIAFLVDFIAMRYYWGERFFGYFNFLRPFVFIFTGYILYFVYKNIKFGKAISFLLLTILVLLILPKSVSRFTLDPFTLDIYKQAKSLENKYPNQKFATYVCSKSYRGNDARLPMAALFVLQKDGKIDENGMRIGVERTRCRRKDQSTKSFAINKLMGTNNHFKEVPRTSFADFSEASPSALSNAGWNPMTFRTIFDSTTRWWFKEQP